MARQKGKGTNGRGTIFEDKHGKWWAQLTADALGKRPKRSAATEQAAAALLRELERERDRHIDPNKRRITLKAHLLAWLKRGKPGWSEKTLEGYEYVCKHYIIPYLGMYRVSELTPNRVQDWINKLHEQGLSVGTIRNAHRRLHAALEEALHEGGMLTRNVASKPKFPKGDAREIEPFTANEAITLLEHAEGTAIETLLYVALRLGLRRGELLGLLWADVKWTEGTLKITGQVQEVRNVLKRQTYTKTAKSRRVLDIDPDLVTALRAHQARQLDHKRNREDWQEHGLVFPSEVGTPFGPRSFDRQYKAILKGAGLPEKRIHDMRHTAASLMGLDGASSTQIRDVLGHTTTRMTDKYTHTYTEGRRRAIEGTGRQLKRKAE